MSDESVPESVTETVILSGVTKRYGGHTAARDVTATLRSGECVALVGHNGAGKSTLIKLMLGLIRPDAGGVVVLGEDPASRGAVRVRREVGFLPENVEFPPAMTGDEVLAFYARLKRLPRSANPALFAKVGLDEAAGRRVGTYSKGMRQRLGLAQALLGQPRLLLLDEPTTGLDPAARRHFYDSLDALRDAGVTILLSSHALTELEGRVDRVLVMRRGDLVAAGTLGDLRARAQLPVRIRLAVAEPEAVPGIVGPGGWGMRPLTPGVVELACAADDKMAVIQRAAAAPEVTDIEIVPPSLDEMVAHFLRQEAAPCP